MTGTLILPRAGRMATDPTPERFVLVPVDREGVLLDLSEGTVLVLNHSAVFVWQRRCEGMEASQIAAALQARYSLPPERARQDVAAALWLAEVPRVPAEPYLFEAVEGGYALSFQGRRILRVEGRGERLALEPGVDLAEGDLTEHVLGLTPKLLSLLGVPVLHASAVAVAGQVRAFSGPSGAGKTTLARAFVDAGADPVAEDKLVVADPTLGTVFAGAERRLREWAGQTGRALRAGPCDCSQLLAAASGSVLPMGEMAFLDPGSRRPHLAEITFTRASPAEAVAWVAVQSFLGSGDRQVWRGQLQRAQALAGAIVVSRVEVPDGVEAMRAAARRAHSVNRAS
jgi:hypothetical protein